MPDSDPNKTLERLANKRTNWRWNGQAKYERYPYSANVWYSSAYNQYRVDMDYSGGRVDMGRNGGYYPTASAAMNAVERKAETLDKQRKRFR